MADAVQLRVARVRAAAFRERFSLANSCAKGFEIGVVGGRWRAPASAGRVQEHVARVGSARTSGATRPFARRSAQRPSASGLGCGQTNRRRTNHDKMPAQFNLDLDECAISGVISTMIDLMSRLGGTYMLTSKNMDHY